MRKSLNQSGFTLIELMIATMVFSVILLLAAIGLIQIGRTYFKGITAARTQEVARDATDDITEAIQFSGAKIKTIASPPSSNAKGFCIDNTRYSYVVNKELELNPSGPLAATQSKHVMVVDTPSGACTSSTQAQAVDTAAAVSGRELLGLHMRLASDPAPVSLGNNLYSVTLNVVYGDQDILIGSPPNYLCIGTGSGGQFCSVSKLTTTVEKRVQ